MRTARTTLAKCRDELMAIASERLAHGDRSTYDRIHAVVKKMRPRTIIRQAPRQRRKVTSELSARIAADAWRHPSEDQMTIGMRHNVNPGRVSVALREHPKNGHLQN